LAQGTRLGYVITGFLDKETLSDTEINPILVEDRGDLAGPNAAYEPTKDKNPMNNNQFDIDEEGINLTNVALMDHKIIHLTNVALMDHKIKEPEDICSQSRTSDTDSSDRESTSIHNSSLQLTKLYTAKEKPINIEPTSHQFKTCKMSDFSSTFLNLTKKYLSFVAYIHTTDVPNNQILRGHNFSPHGNVNFIAKVGVLSNMKKM